ncbi:MAG: putative rane protein [Proteiniphilum sp.]|jgi:uncharacterized integral membrane protein|nr:putative rane protein [Proteiniphilum sp.]MDK2852226.1 hypothetical protein [Proteiniphilum sp.]
MEDQQNYNEREITESPPPIPPTAPGKQDEIPPLKPNSWLWQSIVATVLCCIPFGIVGIVYAAKVDSNYFNGRYSEAASAARKARMWTIIAFCAGLLYMILLAILFATGMLPETMEQLIDNNASGYNF